MLSSSGAAGSVLEGLRRDEALEDGAARGDGLPVLRIEREMGEGRGRILEGKVFDVGAAAGAQAVNTKAKISSVSSRDCRVTARNRRHACSSQTCSSSPKGARGEVGTSIGNPAYVRAIPPARKWNLTAADKSRRPG